MSTSEQEQHQINPRYMKYISVYAGIFTVTPHAISKEYMDVEVAAITE